MQVATKYAHLARNGFPRAIAEALASNRQQCEQAVDNPNPVRCSLDSGKWVAVAKGDQIGAIGNSGRGREDDGFDDHVHFEILHLNVPMSLWTDNRGSWYDTGSARNCIVGYEPKGQSTTEELLHCTWDPTMGDRVMWPVLDVEAYLPPLPASSTPTKDANAAGPNINDQRHVMSITAATPLTARPNQLTLAVGLTIAFWRPTFYTRYYSNLSAPPGKRGLISRTEPEGIAGTGPGVDAYYAHVTCKDGTAKTLGPLTGPANQDGEVPRQTVNNVYVALAKPCVVTVRTSNKHWETGFPGEMLDRAEQNIALRDPSATLTWVAELSAGTNVVRDARALIGDALDLYTFTAYAGYTYSFCTYPSTENVCRDESSGDNDAQLLIVGPAGEVTKPNDQRDENGLTWTAPKSSSAKTTYTLVVRRRARFEGTEADYSYRLKYTIEEIGSCALLNPVEVPVCIPPKPAPSVSSRTHNTVTVSWPRPTGAMSYQTNRLPADASCDTEGVKSTFTPHSADAAGGVRGAGNQDLQYTFPGLTASISYKLCVRSVRTIEPGFVLKSDWSSIPATTKAEQLPKPGGTSVTNVGQNSLTLNWSAVADAGGYKVKRTGSSSTWTLPSTRRSFTFTGLTSDFRYTLYVQALPKAGSTKVASAWARESRRTDSAPPTPIPRQPIDCLSSTDPGDVTYTSGCGFVPASSLLAVLNQRNSDVCAILHWRGGKWLRYGLTAGGMVIPGSNDFQINPGNVLTLGNCGSGSGGVSGASGLETPSCPDAVKPESGAAVIDAVASSCTTVRGGGAVQISRGEYTLNVSLASDRDWFAFAPSSYVGSSAGAFLFLDLSTGGWIALYPPDGVELERHAPADAAALPALLDAIAASASTPATE